jgi:hypothetical protein
VWLLFIITLSFSCSSLIAAAAGLQRVTVTGRSEDCAHIFLAADKGVLDPRVGQNFVHGCTLARVELKHTSDDMSSFAR